MLISIDPGKYATKALSASKKLSFRTKISPDPNIDIAGNTFRIQFQNSSFILGDQAEEQSYDVSKSSNSHKLAVYTAISQLTTDYNVQLALGCPISIYKNQDLRTEYKEYIWGSRKINIQVNSQNHYFYIDNILVLPESCGIVYTNPHLFKSKRVAVIDLGGLNMNFSVYDNYIPQTSSMFTLNLGGMELETKLLTEINIRYGLTLGTQDVHQVIRQGGLMINGKLDTKSISIISEITDVYWNNILQTIKMQNFNLSTMGVCFVGGTSNLIKRRIVDTFPHAFIPENAEWCNAEGFYKIGLIKYGISE